MKTLAIIVSIAFAAPVFACPEHEGAAPTTAEKAKDAPKKEEAPKKEAPKKDESATTAKKKEAPKKSDKVSQK
jgi:hypothetical protein